MLAREAEKHARDHVATLGLRLLEERVAVAVAALLAGEFHFLALLQVEADHAGDQVLDLNAVGADVLHGGGAHLARDEREILRAPEAVAAGFRHEMVPDHAGADHHGDLFEAHVDVFDELDVRVQDRAREVPGEEEVAPRANVQQGLREAVEVEPLQLLHGLILDIASAGHLHPEGILREQIVVQLDPHDCGGV